MATTGGTRTLTLGLGTTAQAFPFQNSMSDRLWLVAFGDEPTAVQNVAAGQETPSRSPPSAPGVGLGTTDQEPPLHDSTSVWFWSVSLDHSSDPR